LHSQSPKVDIPKTIRERIERNQAKYGVYVQQAIATVNEESGIVATSIGNNAVKPIVTVQNGVINGSGNSTIVSNFDLKTQIKEDDVNPQILPKSEPIVQSVEVMQHDLTNHVQQVELESTVNTVDDKERHFDIKKIDLESINGTEFAKLVESDKTYEVKIDSSGSTIENMQPNNVEQSDMLVAQEKPSNPNIRKKSSINLAGKNSKKGSSNNNSFFNKKK
jgi:hypothetical protein